MTERWRSVVGFEGTYEVSDLGRVRSVSRMVERSGQGGYRIQGRVLKTHVNPHGYAQITLARKGKWLSRRVHRLVLEAFVGPRPRGKEARHLDGDRLNNGLHNLKWGTKSENAWDQVRHGTHPQAVKSHCPKGHPYSGPNLSVNGDGRRRCRACHNERYARRAAADPEGLRAKSREATRRYRANKKMEGAA